MSLKKEAIEFLVENRIRNDREFYNSHKDIANKYVIEPLKELVIELTPYMLGVDGEMIVEPKTTKTISRIARDTRYTNDKTLYRDNMWIMFMRRRGEWIKPPGFYFDYSANGFEYGVGFTSTDKSIIDALRELIVSEDETFLDAYEAYNSQDMFTMGGDRYKKDKYTGKYADWLNMKSIYFYRREDDGDVLFGDCLAEHLIKGYEVIRPIYYLLLKAYIIATEMK